MIRLAFTGTHFVGKTTVARAVSDWFGGQVPLYTELAKKIISSFPGQSDWTEKYQLLMYQIHQLPAFITDRSFVCRFSYEKLKPTEGMTMGVRFPRERSLVLRERALAGIRRYGHDFKLVYVPIEFSGERIQTHSGLEVDRVRWDEQIQAVLNEYQVSHIRVTGDVMDRRNQVLEYLGL